MHPPRLPAELACRGTEVQVPVSRKRVLQERHQLRGSDSPASRTREDNPGRGRADHRGQKPQISVGKGGVDRPGLLLETVAKKLCGAFRLRICDCGLQIADCGLERPMGGFKIRNPQSAISVVARHPSRLQLTWK